MSVAVRKHHDVTSAEPHRRLSHDACPAAALCDDMKLHYMLESRHHRCSDVPRRWRFSGPFRTATRNKGRRRADSGTQYVGQVSLVIDQVPEV
jgi:hypothetical protein